MVLRSSDRIPRAPPYLLLSEISVFRLQDFHLILLSIPKHSTILKFCNSYDNRLVPVQSPLLRESLLLSFPPGTKMFQFPGFPSYDIHHMILALQTSVFPHSEIYGSQITYISPQRIAVSCVLHRLLVPRHPPCTLSFLTLQFFCLLCDKYYSIFKDLLDCYFTISNCYVITFVIFLRKTKSFKTKQNRWENYTSQVFMENLISKGYLLNPIKRYLNLSPQKGGDPSPRSRRDTLLRLHPNHLSHLRRLPPCG